MLHPWVCHAQKSSKPSTQPQVWRQRLMRYVLAGTRECGVYSLSRECQVLEICKRGDGCRVARVTSNDFRWCWVLMSPDAVFIRLTFDGFSDVTSCLVALRFCMPCEVFKFKSCWVCCNVFELLLHLQCLDIFGYLGMFCILVQFSSNSYCFLFVLIIFALISFYFAEFDGGTSAHKTSAGFPWPVLGLWRWSNAWGSQNPCGTRPKKSEGPKRLAERITSIHFMCRFVQFSKDSAKIYKRLIVMNWNDSERIERPQILPHEPSFLFAHM